jgi:hypothetical protein
LSLQLLRREIKKAKKKTALIMKILLIMLVSSLIGFTFLTVGYQALIKEYYPGSLALIYSELFLLELLWMIVLLIIFIMINILIWYSLHYSFISKSIIKLETLEEPETTELICYKCGTNLLHKTSNNISNHEVKSLEIFNKNNDLCKRCFQSYLRRSASSIMFLPLTYLLIMLLIPLILVIRDFAYLPDSYNYLLLSFTSVLFYSVITFTIYLICGSIYSSKIYNR